VKRRAMFHETGLSPHVVLACSGRIVGHSYNGGGRCLSIGPVKSRSRHLTKNARSGRVTFAVTVSDLVPRNWWTWPEPLTTLLQLRCSTFFGLPPSLPFARDAALLALLVAWPPI
jgi:hypothetical protein